MTSTVQLRREEEKEQRRNDILDAAEQIIAERGWAETNFSEIAKVTRLSRSLMYVYFPTREELFHAICNRGAAVLEAVFKEAMAAEKTGLDQVEAIGRAYHRFSREYPIYFKLHAEQQTMDEEGGPEGSPSYSHPAFTLLARALSRGLADGSITSNLGDIKVSALTLWTFTHGLLLIASRKEKFLRERMQIDSQAIVDHGFGLMRRMLTCKDGGNDAATSMAVLSQTLR